MQSTRRPHADDLRGVGRLAVDATRSVTDIVQAMHRSIGAGPGNLFDGLHVFSAPIYAIIRGVTTAVGAGLELLLAGLAPLLGEGAPGFERDAVVAALNGVLGDHLEATGNPLATRMELRHAPSATGGRLLVLVHGLAANERQWRRRGFDHGAALAERLGVTPVYLRYNSGRHVSTNGRAFAGELERLVAEWPVPVESIDLLAHSMGGLVARSACRAGEEAGHRWRRLVRHLVFLGTPHHGAPLERAGHWVDLLLPIHRHSAPLARLGKLRSAGITDLRHGNVLDEHWADRDRFARGGDTRTPLPLPVGVACHAVAGTLTTLQDGRLGFDGLVPVDSALGRHLRRELTLAFGEADRFVALGAGHLDLLDRADVNERIAAWLSATA